MLKTATILAVCFGVLLAQAPSDNCNTNEEFEAKYAGNACLLDAISNAYSISKDSGEAQMSIDNGTTTGATGSKICPETIVKNADAGIRTAVTNNGADTQSIETMNVQVYYSGNLFYQYTVHNCKNDLPAQTETDVNYLVNIPSIAPPGNWMVKLLGMDANGSEVFGSKTTFTIQ